MMISLEPRKVSLLCGLMEVFGVSHIHRNGEQHAQFLSQCRIAYFLDNDLHFGVPTASQGIVLILRKTNRTFLEHLQQVRYPWIGIWCLLVCMTNLNQGLEGLCDSFLLETTMDDAHEVKKTQCVVAFTLQPPANVCNKAGIFGTAIRNKLSGQTLSVAWGSADLYTTPKKKASQVSKLAVGHVEGFERALLNVLSHYLNFSVIWSAEYDLAFGIRPLQRTFWNKTVLRFLLEREVHLIFGDLSLLHPRELYCDFTDAHDTDSASFLSLVRIRPLNMWSVIQLTGYLTVTLYFALSAAVGYWTYLRQTSSIRRRSSTSSSYILFAILLIFCQQRRDSGPSRVWLVLVHRICVFFLASTFSSSLVNTLANPALEGRLDELSEILDAVFVRNAHLISNINFINNLGNSADNPRLNQIATRLEACGTIQDCSNRLFSKSGSAFLLGEGLHHAREIWARNAKDAAHISKENFYNLFQSFGLQKGCLFRRVLTKKIHQTIDSGLMERFKEHAGLQLINEVVLTAVQEPIKLSGIQETILGIFIVQILAALVLSAELVFYRSSTLPFVRVLADNDILRRLSCWWSRIR